MELDPKTITPRKVFVNLLRELPPDKVVIRYMSAGPITASKMAILIEESHELGLQYISDFFRLARDMLAARE